MSFSRRKARCKWYKCLQALSQLARQIPALSSYGQHAAASLTETLFLHEFEWVRTGARATETLFLHAFECDDRHVSAGISIWDLESREELMHIPTCASSPRGLLCLRNQFLVASQLQRHGSYGGGAIFIWPLNKHSAISDFLRSTLSFFANFAEYAIFYVQPQALLRSYTMELIGPISCTEDGLFVFGGSPSGHVYVWDVPSGRLLKNWAAHHKSVTCLALSDDDSLLISGAQDGRICVWTLMSVLDLADSQMSGSLPSFHSLSEHGGSITGLLTSSASSSVLVSSSLDGTCKVWNLVIGCLLQTHTFSGPVTAIVLDPAEQFLFCGTKDGRIFINALDIGLQDNPPVLLEDQMTVLSGHKGSITALSFTMSGLQLVSASEDCTACVWDSSNWQITCRFNHKKGPITNLVVIPRSSLHAAESQRSSPRLRVSVLEKATQLTRSADGTSVLLPSQCLLEDHLDSTAFQSSHSLNRQISDFEQRGRTPEAIQMKVETSVENRVWAVSMTKHLTTMNKHLQSRLLDLMERRLSSEIDVTIEKRKKTKVNALEGRSEPPA
ncbi:hypothetical protein ACLOJK_011979 [Asimina triloba]